jgi:hypothetical protein
MLILFSEFGTSIKELFKENNEYLSFHYNYRSLGCNKYVVEIYFNINPSFLINKIFLLNILNNS